MAKKSAAKKTTRKTAKRSAKRAPAVGRGEVADRPPAHDPPIRLAELVGHPRPVEVMRNALASGRLHHCWLFSGPRGVGKFTAALAFAALLLDPTTAPNLAGEPEADPGGEIAGLLRGATHPDLHVVTKELAAFSREANVRGGKQTTIPAEVLREFLIEPAALAPRRPPGGAASRVFIVDEAELMGGGQRVAQNALLKTLEEPPPGAVFMLVTSSEDRLLPTIRSRSQRLAFLPLADADLRAWAAARFPGLSSAEIDRVVALADGSPGVARELVEDNLLAWHDQIDPMLDAAMAGRFPAGLGAAMAGLADDWAKDWVKGDDRRSKDTANRAAAAKLFRLVGLHARRVMHAGAAPEWAIASAHAVTRAEERLAANTQLAMVFEGLAADLAEAGRRYA